MIIMIVNEIYDAYRIHDTFFLFYSLIIFIFFNFALLANYDFCFMIIVSLFFLSSYRAGHILSINMKFMARTWIWFLGSESLFFSFFFRCH